MERLSSFRGTVYRLVHQWGEGGREGGRAVEGGREGQYTLSHGSEAMVAIFSYTLYSVSGDDFDTESGWGRALLRQNSTGC